MEDLIKALQIFSKYKNKNYPTFCGHDIFVVCHISEDEVSDEDKIQLKKLSFSWSDEYDGWSSFRFGSC